MTIAVSHGGHIILYGEFASFKIEWNSFENNCCDLHNQIASVVFNLWKGKSCNAMLWNQCIWLQEGCPLCQVFLKWQTILIKDSGWQRKTQVLQCIGSSFKWTIYVINLEIRFVLANNQECFCYFYIYILMRVLSFSLAIQLMLEDLLLVEVQEERSKKSAYSLLDLQWKWFCDNTLQDAVNGKNYNYHACIPEPGLLAIMQHWLNEC